MRSKASDRGSDLHPHPDKASNAVLEARKSSSCRLFGACPTASSDRLHLHCTSLSHAKLVAPDKVAANVTAWLEPLGLVGLIHLRLAEIPRTERRTYFHKLCHALVLLRKAKSAKHVRQQSNAEPWTRKSQAHVTDVCGDADLIAAFEMRCGSACPPELLPYDRIAQLVIHEYCSARRSAIHG